MHFSLILEGPWTPFQDMPNNSAPQINLPQIEDALELFSKVSFSTFAFSLEANLFKGNTPEQPWRRNYQPTSLILTVLPPPNTPPYFP